MKEKFINRYSLSKTLRFSLIPVGKTEENFDANNLLEKDSKRAEDYEKVKGYIDRYHKAYIESVLPNVRIEGVDAYAELYWKSGKSESDIKAMESYEAKMRKQIAKVLTSGDRYKRLFGKELIYEDLPGFLSEKEEKEIVESFRNFSTYFVGFYDNRKNMYTDKEQSTAISYRCINQNLPRFLDNIKTFSKIEKALSKDNFEKLNNDFFNIYGKNVNDIFCLDFFEFVLHQTGIDTYNSMIGGYTCTDGTKIQGLNEYINIYNQKVAKSDKALRLPLIKPLYKQILSDKESISFIPENFKTDDELLSSINEYYNLHSNKFDELLNLFADIRSFNLDSVYIKSGTAITNISKAVFGDWNTIRSAWNKKYEKANPIKPNTDIEKYNSKRDTVYKSKKSFSIAELQSLEIESDDCNIKSIADCYSLAVEEFVNKIKENYSLSKELLNNKYDGKYDKKLCQNKTATELIKNLLDSMKELELFVKPLLGTGKEENKDELFYGRFAALYDSVSAVDKLYDKVRNYITQKPYSKDKIKLNFENPTFLDGWALGNEFANAAQLFFDGKYYYLAVMDKKSKSIIPKQYNCPGDSNDEFFKIIYQQAADPAKDIPNLLEIDGLTVKKNGRKEKQGENAGENIILENLRNTYLPENINRIRKSQSYSVSNENFSKSDLSEYIEYYIERVSAYYNTYNFKFKKPDDYKSYYEFLTDVNSQAYQISYQKVSYKQILELVDSGALYLFKIYNKDFSESSHGKPNLHTMYFKMLFDERNLSDVVYKLNGEAEMFYRKASINDNEKIVHYANNPIKNKNSDNKKGESVFEYDLVKDKRFTKRQFSLHIPITINFKARGQEFINNDVRIAVKEKLDNYVIGIDRGERNLIYVCLINSKGEIVEQMSLNEIISDNEYKVDYRKLLDQREKERDKAKKSWNTVENIKELKEGYISQVVHKICQLILKYDAVIAMEDLNFGFKRGRFKVEKQVYQKFENMLISKLNLLIDKTIPPESEGGLLHAYQLTNKYDGINKGKQNGIIFYVPAWDTSKIDPATGFVNLLKPKYTSVAEAKKLFNTMDGIRYNEKTDMFEFDIDYGKFPKCNADFRKKWTVCTNKDRIETFINKDKNSEWDNRRIMLTDEFKAVFAEHGVDYKNNLKENILSVSDANFYKRLVKLFALTLQMRNSITGSALPQDDFLISPVADKNGVFYDSRNFTGVASPMPCDADANGAYNIARKGLWAIDVLKNTDDNQLSRANLAISNAQWLEFAQK